MKPFQTLLLAGCIAGAFASSAQADTLVQYQFTNSHSGLSSYDPNFRDPDVLAPHLSSTTVNNEGSGNIVGPTSSNTSGIQGGGNPFPDTLFINAGHSSVGFFTTPGTAVAGNNYFQFTMTPDGGYVMTLTELSFDAAKGGASDPRGWVLRSSRDGFATDLGAQTIPTIRPTTTHFAISLASALFAGVTDATTFRVYAYAPSGTNVGAFYDNLSVTGTVSAVPLPGAVWLFGATLPLVIRARRKQLA